MTNRDKAASDGFITENRLHKHHQLFHFVVYMTMICSFVKFFTYSFLLQSYNLMCYLSEWRVRMKQTILKKLLVSGAAALGIMGLSTPAAFAWSGNSGYGNNNYRPSYSSYNKHDSYDRNSYSPCHKSNDYSSNMYPSYGNGYEKNNDRNSMNNSSSVAVAFAFAAASSNSSSNSFNNNRW